MGLFDKFKGGDDVRLTPFLASVVSLVYCQAVDAFLREAAPMLNFQQKLCILCNMADCLLADGEAEA
jgi:hypothetical protein